MTGHDSLTSVSVEAIEFDIWVGVWSVTAWAICGTPVGNQQRISFQSTNDSTSPKNAVATCPAPLRLYGMGAELTNAQGQVFLDDYDVDSGLTRANAGAYEHGTFTDNWTIISYAICGDAGATMVRTSSSSAQDGNPMKTQGSPECPVGTQLHGMGTEITGGLGEAMLDRIKPWPTIYTGSMTDARAVEVVGSSPANPSWKISSYGICVG